MNRLFQIHGYNKENSNITHNLSFLITFEIKFFNKHFNVVSSIAIIGFHGYNLHFC